MVTMGFPFPRFDTAEVDIPTSPASSGMTVFSSEVPVASFPPSKEPEAASAVAVSGRALKAPSA